MSSLATGCSHHPFLCRSLAFLRVTRYPTPPRPGQPHMDRVEGRQDETWGRGWRGQHSQAGIKFL